MKPYGSITNSVVSQHCWQQGASMVVVQALFRSLVQQRGTCLMVFFHYGEILPLAKHTDKEEDQVETTDFLASCKGHPIQLSGKFNVKGID